MKRKALKGLLIVLIVLTFCFFFSGTVKTLTTAKVLFASVKTGKLKTQVMLTGYLAFSETQDITWDNLPAGISMRVTEILIAKGQEVKTGDPLFQIEITGLSEAVKAQEAVYQEAEKGLLALENQYANLRLTRADQNWIDAYDALYTARQNSHFRYLYINPDWIDVPDENRIEIKTNGKKYGFLCMTQEYVNSIWEIHQCAIPCSVYKEYLLYFPYEYYEKQYKLERSFINGDISAEEFAAQLDRLRRE